MPELPEVESVRRVLEPQLRGLRIARIEVARPEVIAHPGAEEFCARVAGRVIERMGRRGKFLSLHLDGGDRILLHLRMTGCLLLTPADLPPERHTHVIFHLDDGAELRFSDPRRFGRFWLIGAGEADVYSGAEKLGIEPWDAKLTAGYLREAFGGSRRAIKDCLLDQRVVAGIGNIYSDEILFAVRIRPSRPASSLTEAEWARLAAAIPERMGFFVEKNEISPEEYLTGRGQDYRNTPYLRVYGHAGRPVRFAGGGFAGP